MIIKKQTAKKAIKKGTAREVGTCVHDRARYVIVERLDLRRTDHYYIGDA